MSRGDWVQKTISVASLVVSLLTISTVAWQGGRLSKQVEIDSGRLAALENVGSPALQAHEKADGVAAGHMERRLTHLESLMPQFTSLDANMAAVLARLAVVEEQLRNLARSLDEHRNSTMKDTTAAKP